MMITENDVCGVTLSLYPHQASWKIGWPRRESNLRPLEMLDEFLKVQYHLLSDVILRLRNNINNIIQIEDWVLITETFVV